VGLVVRVEENTASIFSDVMQEEIKVLLSDIQTCSETSSGRVRLGQYALHDLVQLSYVLTQKHRESESESESERESERGFDSHMLVQKSNGWRDCSYRT
jgi:hypothetical protein